ncbi:MAG: class I SAM-dependent methyltransferase [Chloroflexi bacterium]|nr:class I SAM-dependent methyltransferase [Chloroflexota bacterium]
MYKKELIEFWKREEAEPFIGWNFSHLDGRMLEEKAPWSYETRAVELLRCSWALLDMGTGGGERLLTMQEYWPKKVTVTEDYPPNYRLARERLEPHGVRVTDANLSEENLMPFSDGEFDLVINRHSSFNSAEVGRILSPKGVFFTEQVHGLWAEDLAAAFGVRYMWEDSTPEHYIPRLEAAGLKIENAQEWKGRLEFTDVGAVVYYLKAIPWTVPGFTVQTHLDYLLKLEDRLQEEGELVFTARLYLIEAVKK